MPHDIILLNLTCIRKFYIFCYYCTSGLYANKVDAIISTVSCDYASDGCIALKGFMLRCIGFFFAAVLLSYVGYLTDWRTMGEVFSAHWLGLSLMFMCGFLPMIATAESMRQLLLGKSRCSFYFCFYITWMRVALQIFLPSAAAIAADIACVFLLRSRGLKAENAISVMAILSIIALCSMMLFGIIGLSWFVFKLKLFKPTYFIGISVCVLIFLCIFIFYAIRFNLLQKLMFILQKFLPRNSKKSNTKMIERWFKWYIRHWKILFNSVVWQFIQWFLVSLNFYLTAVILDIPLSFLAAITLVSTVFITSMIVFFLPAGLGGVELGFIAIGTMLGLSPTQAMTLALFQRGSTFIAYAPALFLWKQKKKSK